MDQPSSDPIDADGATDIVSESANETGDTPQPQGPENGKKRKAAPKTQAEILARRREGRLKAAATIANNLKKTGIARVDAENGFPLTTVRQASLINQKNYYADYLKKDEQVTFVRNWRSEKLTQTQNNTKLKKPNKADTGTPNGENVNFSDYNLEDIEAEMRKKKEKEDEERRSALSQVRVEDDDEEDDEDADEEMSEEKARQGYDTIVIQPGSQTIKIGRATDAYPELVPAVIAVPRDSNGPKIDDDSPAPKRTEDEEGNVSFGEDFDKMKDVVTKDFKARMKYYKRRILPNSRESAASFNRKQVAEKIPDHNDPHRKDWLDQEDIEGRSFFVGEEALKLPVTDKSAWILRYPISGRDFSEDNNYLSPQEVLGDLCNIIIETLRKMEIPQTEFGTLKVLLVIPDLYNKVYVEKWCDMLFKQLNFGQVAIIQEAVAATFGAGTQSSCVVDVGAQTTTVTCVDEGLVIPNSRIKMNFGGDHITETFIKLLLEQQFPYRDIDLNRKTDDWELAEDLKKSYVTFQDADIAVQHYKFFKRKPRKTTEKYDFKVFDEVMVAPLGLFYPGIFGISDDVKKQSWLFSPSVDQYSLKPNNPYSKAQENIEADLVHADLSDDQMLLEIVHERNKTKNANPFAKPKPTRTSTLASYKYHKVTVPLEKAIIESITNASMTTEFSKLKKFYDNLLIVGGGFAKIPAFDFLLTDRINIWRPKFLSSTAMDDILDYVSDQIKKNEDEKNRLINELKEKKLQQLKIKQKEENEANGDNNNVKVAPKIVKKKDNDEDDVPVDDDEEALTAKAGEELTLDDVELEPAQLEKIKRQATLEFDLEYIDSLSDKGSLVPVNVLPPPREFDPEILTWKGGCVYARLKVIQEMWISASEWDLLENRCLYYKSIFNY